MGDESKTGEKTWTIVKFVDENTVAMVPTVWISNTLNDLYSLWPPLPTSKITVAVKNN